MNAALLAAETSLAKKVTEKSMWKRWHEGVRSMNATGRGGWQSEIGNVSSVVATNPPDSAAHAIRSSSIASTLPSVAQNP